MNEILHQVWLGGPMPDKFKAWTATARQWANSMGMHYRLWGEEELWHTFGHEPELDTLRTCMETLPTPTTWSFLSDFFRFRLLAEFGGLYLDADTDCSRAVELPTAPGVYCSREGFNPTLWSTWLLWAPGEGGRKTAQALWAEARRHFNEVLPPGAADIPSRFVWMMRRDMKGHGAGAMGLGPRVFRRVLLPALRHQGWHIDPLPEEMASVNLHTAALHQVGAASWHEKGADWNERAQMAKCREFLATAPPWCRPQSSRELPPANTRQQPPAHIQPQPDGLMIPRTARRIVIFSNVPGFSPARVELRPGDHCIHINRARQFPKVCNVPGVTHAVAVRGGKDKQTGQKVQVWYSPPSTRGMLQVLHINDAPMATRRKWWRQYWADNPGKGPTSGFICWHLAQEAAPSLPIILAGFAPGEDFGSPQYSGHAWNYEAEAYARAHAYIIRPDNHD